MAEYHTTVSWTLPDGRGGFWADLVVETTDAISATVAFEAWCRNEGEREHAENCEVGACPIGRPHPYAVFHITGPVGSVDNPAPHEPGVVEMVDSGPCG